MNTHPASSYSLLWVIFAIAMGGFCIGTTEFVAMGLIQEIAKDLQVSIPDAGHFISAYALGVVIGAPIIAISCAQLPRKMLLLILMLFYGVANAFTALAHAPETVLLSRFIAGLPHGAYFGVGALVTAQLANPKQQSTAVALMMMGLTSSTVVGVPLATWMGQQFGWRAGFEFSATIAVITLIAIIFFVPNISVHKTASVKNELAGLKNINMWLTLAVAAIGFGGMFSTYSYISPILTEYTQADITVVPMALAIWGVGMVIGGLLSGHFADKNLNKTIVGILISSALTFICVCFLMKNLYTAIIGLFFIGLVIIGLSNTLQMRLMHVAGDAQGLAASLNHSAFNLANALGAFLGGWAINHHLGWLSPIWIGSILSLGGLLILAIAFMIENSTQNSIK